MKQESFRAAVNVYEQTMEEDQKEGKYAWRGAKWMTHKANAGCDLLTWGFTCWNASGVVVVVVVVLVVVVVF